MATPKGVQLKAIHRIQGANGALDPGTVFMCPVDEAERLLRLGAAEAAIDEPEDDAKS